MSVKDIIKIGRSSESNYRVDEDSVSNDHAILIISEGGKYLLIDCNSMNGTRLPNRSGGEKITQSKVDIDDLMFFGEHQCTVHDLLSSRKEVHAVVSNSEFTQVRDPVNGTIKKKLR
jgi:hypothetical protein